ncbi:PEP-CTERM sorting domain-containing protein [Geobacter sp.]|uniref:PEP-CTERM sorting domain-containing protein n=1 Tax=Geobacter sp. TaxID=46610 RepID=UPI0027B8E74D|nr:PEP-CTERM sorting domain-containing protein [Geobacter sp.]
MKSAHFRAIAIITLFCAVLFSRSAIAVTTTFFDPSQTATTSPGDISDTIDTEGYRFTYSLDKHFTGGTGTEIGRQELYVFPSEANVPIGLHAQAVTASDPTGSAQINISRVDGSIFDLNALTFRLLANTSGAGANMEITPVLNGNDGQMVFLEASGGYNSTFSYSTSLSSLIGYDAYNLSLYVDFALLGVTLTDATVVPPPIDPELPPGPGPTPVPEPGTYAMMLVGLGVLGRIQFKVHH